MWIFAVLFVSAAAYGFCRIVCQKRDFYEVFDRKFVIIFFGLFIRLFLGYFFEGFPNDIACFKSWSIQLAEQGPSRFYVTEGLTDYPPVYMYILTIVGIVRRVFSIDYGAKTFTLLVKLPAICADVASAMVVYRLAKPKIDEKRAFFAASLLLLNPTIILDSSVWGQVDSIHTLLMVIIVYLLAEKKLLQASLVFVAAALTKPQAIMVAPIFVYAFGAYLNENKWKVAAFGTLFKYLGACVLFAFILVAPFSPIETGFLGFSAEMVDGALKFGSFKFAWFQMAPVFNKYLGTLQSYNVATVNAYNVYNMFNLNWKNLSDVDATFLGINYAVWGFLAIAAVSCAAVLLLCKKKGKYNFYLVSALIIMTVFMFSVKMHERYCYPALLFVLIAYVKKKDKYLLYAFCGLTLAFFIHYADVYRMGIDNFNYSLIDKTKIWFSYVMFAGYVFFVFCQIKAYRTEQPKDVTLSFKERDYSQIMPSITKIALNTKEFIFVASITGVYAILAFTNLGNLRGSTTFYDGGKNYFDVVFDLGYSANVGKMQYFTNYIDNLEFTVWFSEDNFNYYSPIKVDKNSVFRWEDLEIGNVSARYVKIEPYGERAFRMGEIAFRDIEGRIINTKDVFGVDGVENLIDEPQFVPEQRDHMNSTYFDEIYHPRTAYEFVHNLPVYEWTHPPLGKLIMSLGVRLFGMTPFGWRFMGALFGVLMVPFIFLFAKYILKNFVFAATATVAFTFDFMHYAQTRLATIDTYITFFVILMYFFMYKYTLTNFNEKKQPFRKTLTPLFLSGLFMGMGIASKWPGVYAGAGLAIIFFLYQGERFNEFLAAKKTFREKGGRQAPYIVANYKKHLILTLFACIVFFIVVPLCVYVLSYVPYYFEGGHALYPLAADHELAKFFPKNEFGRFLSAIAKNSIEMFNYHAYLVSEHSFSSKWWEWIFDLRPIWYYTGTVNPEIKQGISSFGNPMVWYFGFAGFVYAAYKWCVDKCRTARFLVAGYLAQLLPWILVARTTYIYHYFPCTPFLAVLYGYMLKDFCLKEMSTKGSLFRTYAPLSLSVCIIILFIMFYPVLTGINVNVFYVHYFLEWFPRWNLI